jgi:hypothetical protein
MFFFCVELQCVHYLYFFCLFSSDPAYLGPDQDLTITAESLSLIMGCVQQILKSGQFLMSDLKSNTEHRKDLTK